MTLLFGMPGAPEILLILVIVLLIFGGKKIPELMKGLGKGVKEFKKGMEDIKDIKSDIEKPVGKQTEDVK